MSKIVVQIVYVLLTPNDHYYSNNVLAEYYVIHSASYDAIHDLETMELQYITSNQARMLIKSLNMQQIDSVVAKKMGYRMFTIFCHAIDKPPHFGKKLTEIRPGHVIP
jgi:hypothetical protein